MNAAVIFTPRLSRLTMPTALLPELVYVEMLLGLAILSPLPLVSIPTFPPTLVGNDDFLTANNEFLTSDGENLSW